MNSLSIHTLLFVLAVAVFVVSTAIVLIESARQERKSADVEWQDLVARLDQVNRDAVREIAIDVLEGSDRIAPEALYGMLGGLDGLERLERNCAVLVDLATHVQRWQPEAVAVAEELRLAAREMRWHVERLQGAAAAGHLKSTFPDYARRAVRVYYGMTRRVLNLYEDTAMARVSVLEHVL